MRVFFLVLTGICLLINASNLKADVKWMLLGIVVHKVDLHPVADMRVCIEALSCSQHICVTTLSDGYFQFSLEKEEEYVVQLLDQENNLIASKKVSTLGREESGVMHLVLDF